MSTRLHPLTPPTDAELAAHTRRGAQSQASEDVRRAAALIRQAEEILHAADGTLRAAKAWYGQGDVEDYARLLGDRGDAECGTLAEQLERLADTLRAQAAR